MDPLGFGRDLFRIIGLFYWGLALLLVCIALVKPKRLVFKLAWATGVVGVFVSPLIFRSNEVLRINTAFKDSCSQVQSSIQPVASDSTQFVDHEVVWLGRSNPPYASDSIRYMLERKLTALELTYDPQFWNDIATNDTKVPDPQPGTKPSPHSWGVQPGIYVRLTLKNTGHDSCKGFMRWSSEYPSQRWPWMQKLGMRSDQCIGFELVNQLQSQHGIYVDRLIIETNGNNGALETHKYRLRDHQSSVDLGTATLAISSVYSHRDVLCGGDAIAKQLNAAIQSTPDPRYAKVEEVKLEWRPSPTSKNLSIEELRARELNIGDASISSDRKAWTDTRYERRDGGSISLLGYELVSLWKDRLYHIPLPSVTAASPNPIIVGANPNSVFVLIRTGYQRDDGGVLHEFSRVGEPIREQLLSAEQIEALGLRY